MRTGRLHVQGVFRTDSGLRHERGILLGLVRGELRAPLVAAEVVCRARGDAHCRFIMALPDKITAHIARYGERSRIGAVDFGDLDS